MNLMTGNVTNVSVQYDRTSQTITCTSTGGPATDVTWSKDNVTIRLTMGDFYEHSQIIINITSATYENRLRIVDKSSEAAGNYTCSIINPRGGINESLYIQGNYYEYKYIAVICYYEFRNLLLTNSSIIVCLIITVCMHVKYYVRKGKIIVTSQ